MQNKRTCYVFMLKTRAMYRLFVFFVASSFVYQANTAAATGRKSLLRITTKENR